MVARSGCFSIPTPVVALPCGSESISRTRKSLAASEAARLIAVVVFPTPPFWFVTAITLLRASTVSLLFHVKQGQVGAHCPMAAVFPPPRHLYQSKPILAQEL